jgi:hypothetical protein
MEAAKAFDGRRRTRSHRADRRESRFTIDMPDDELAAGHDAHRSTHMAQAIATTDHDTIRRWIEERNGHPAVVKATHGERGGLLRIDFGPPEESLDPIDWDEFFETFDSNNLAFLYQDKTAGGRKSRFAKFVDRDSIAAKQAQATDDE